MLYHGESKNVKFKIRHNIMIVALIGLLLLSVIPALFSGSSSIIQFSNLFDIC
jgi:hypothetical protein